MAEPKVIRTASHVVAARKGSVMESILIMESGYRAYDELSTQMLSVGSSSMPSTVLMDQPTIVSSSCSSSSFSVSGSSSALSSVLSSSSSSNSHESLPSLPTKESSSTLFSASGSHDDDKDKEKHSAVPIGSSKQQVPKQGVNSRNSSAVRSTSSLSLELDSVLRLVRLGKSVGLRHKCQLPLDISKADIHVTVDIDQKLNCGKFEESILAALLDDLRTVYSADSQGAKLFLCVVIVTVTDGSFVRSLWDRNGVMGLAEIGLVWRLFEADDLTVYDGGLVVKSQDVVASASVFDISVAMGIRGRDYLLNKLAPCVANDIMSRIADANDALLCEI